MNNKDNFLADEFRYHKLPLRYAAIRYANAYSMCRRSSIGEARDMARHFLADVSDFQEITNAVTGREIRHYFSKAYGVLDDALKLDAAVKRGARVVMV